MRKATSAVVTCDIRFCCVLTLRVMSNVTSSSETNSKFQRTGCDWLKKRWASCDKNLQVQIIGSDHSSS